MREYLDRKLRELVASRNSEGDFMYCTWEPKTRRKPAGVMVWALESKGCQTDPSIPTTVIKYRGPLTQAIAAVIARKVQLERGEVARLDCFAGYYEARDEWRRKYKGECDE
jgi:hypothetical protein